MATSSNSSSGSRRQQTSNRRTTTASGAQRGGARGARSGQRGARRAVTLEVEQNGSESEKEDASETEGASQVQQGGVEEDSDDAASDEADESDDDDESTSSDLTASTITLKLKGNNFVGAKKSTDLDSANVTAHNAASLESAIWEVTRPHCRGWGFCNPAIVNRQVKGKPNNWDTKDWPPQERNPNARLYFSLTFNKRKHVWEENGSGDRRCNYFFSFLHALTNQPHSAASLPSNHHQQEGQKVGWQNRHCHHLHPWPPGLEC